MKRDSISHRLLALVACLCAAVAQAQDAALGSDVEALLHYARQHNPDYAGMRYEADAASERAEPAGALPDPKFRTELRDVTRMGEQNATLAPNRVGSTRYLVMQDVPWFGKRDLKREVAELEAAGARGRALATWSDVAAKIKATYAQLYYVSRNERLTKEILDLLTRLERIARMRYSGGLAAQQDVVRAQVEQTLLRSELVDIETEQHHLHTRLNLLLARPARAPLATPERLRTLPPPAGLEFAALERRVRARNPLLSAADSGVRAAEKGRELAYRNRYPDFTFGVSPIQYQNSLKEWELMVELNIPLQRDSRRAQEREAEALLASANSRREATANQVLAELAENFAALDAARRNQNLSGDSLLAQAELGYQSALAGYENGKLDFATLLDAQRQIRQAKQNQIKAQAEAQMRLAEIERLLGEDL
ncbi:MAG: TolC family protein [Rhodocyclaceae bacterium]|nr:TolC family protein [Rhodocyclaceae bacterium]